jgi:hypothetical protein
LLGSNIFLTLIQCLIPCHCTTPYHNLMEVYSSRPNHNLMDDMDIPLFFFKHMYSFPFALTIEKENILMEQWIAAFKYDR